jgi:ribonuclease R
MPEDEKDIPIPRDGLGGALSGDIVEVALRKGQRETIGYVTKIFERKKASFVGEVIRGKDGMMLHPDDSRVYMDFMIVGGVGAPPGHKVIADVTNWDSNPAQVTVRRALGMAGVHDTEIRAILAGRGFDADFPQDVIREADQLYEHPWDEAEIAKRRDMRSTLTFTIDPDDAKDFDDAISYKDLGDGTIEVGVHIADVSHFVRPGSALDRDAQKRATSVYLVDRTIPMLPPQLSEDLCSLKPDVDRLTFSAIFTIKGTAVIDRWFGRTIIHSTKRFTYDEADATLKDATLPLHTELNTIWKFASHLRKKRIEFGAVSFDRDEVKPVLNDKKEVVGFRRVTHTESHQLIEELMLMANREVAGLVTKVLGKKARVFLYRIHDVPNVEKLEELAVFLRAIGYTLTLTASGVEQKELNRMLASVKGTPEEDLIKTATVRTMTRAIYATKNIGHFGLSFKDYAHFTSPIRRYPDLLVHRMLAKVLNNEKVTESPEVMDQMAVHVSTREAEAADAERSSIKMKQVEYFAKKIGEVRYGVISGVTEWGIYCEDKESGAEGMVRLMSIPGDTFEYNPKKFAAVGVKTGKVLRLGDPVSFKIEKVDIRERTIDLSLVG